MQCVPVLDIRQGMVVHAVRGARDHYQRLQTPLAPDAEPANVLAGLLTLHPFRYCYIADLDALQHKGHNDHRIAMLVAQHPGLEFWIDASFGDRTSMPWYVALTNVRCVVGSESLQDLPAWQATRARCSGRGNPLLSLDHAHGAPLGPRALSAVPAQWPSKVIAMNLDRVGSGEGPDTGLIDEIRRAAPNRQIIAAGGVRDGQDLERLAASGVTAVLVATALHDGRIDARSLSALSYL